MKRSLKPKIDNKKILKYFWFYSILILLSILRAFQTYVFILPNNFAPGGINGLAIIVYKIVSKYNAPIASTVFNPGIFSLILNIPLLIAAAKILNKKFAINTLASVLTYSLILWLFELVHLPQFVVVSPESSGMILAVLTGGLLSGLSLGFMLLMNMSSGGTDIIARLVYKKNPAINVQWLILIFDSIVVLLSGIIGIISIEKGMSSSAVFVLVMSPILFSCINMFTSSKVADVILSGIESSVVFNIITKKSKEITEYVVTVLNRSATILTGEGCYTHEDKQIVIVVVSRKQRVNFRKSILRLDPNAFMYVTSAKEVNGQGFSKTKNDN